jgi:hypothetical protein
MREQRERLQEAGRGSVEPTACHLYAGDGERRPRGGRMLPRSSVARARAKAEVGTDAGRAGLASWARNGAAAR